MPTTKARAESTEETPSLAGTTTEHGRLADMAAGKADWQRWGPYLSERAWGTVREDYSAPGEAWEFFPHEHARSRVYRWNEDGLAGVCDRDQIICMSVALWNERDTMLKERLFGLTGTQGNHGEDVKEYYFYLDNTPTHSYMKMLYKYPQVAYPYDALVAEHQQRDCQELEFELIDALQQAFDEHRYFDVTVEYAKVDAEDVLCRITATNHGPDRAPIHILPHLWYRNTWSWEEHAARPEIVSIDKAAAYTEHPHLGQRWWFLRSSDRQDPQLLFTENETNLARLYGVPDVTPNVKDGIDDAVVYQHMHRVNPMRGSKVAAHFKAILAPGETFTVQVRFARKMYEKPFANIETVMKRRQQEADEFYAAMQPPELTDDARLIQRQAFAGLLWSKQFYHYHVERWLNGDPGQPVPPEERLQGRNHTWSHFQAADVLSMPDTWEYPWFAAWDLAFHCIPLALIDPAFARAQLLLMVDERYQHPNGQIPAYEWNFSDQNPPVLAWATWRVYQIAQRHGTTDLPFLTRMFERLLLHFNWWMSRTDAHGKHVLEGGFFGVDGIGVLDRTMLGSPEIAPPRIEQSDALIWSGVYCLNLLTMALELADKQDPAYEETAIQLFEQFLHIVQTMHSMGLWDNEDGFFYDLLRLDSGQILTLKARSLSGLIPLCAVMTVERATLDKLTGFRERLAWYQENRPDLAHLMAPWYEPGHEERHLIAMVNEQQIQHILQRMLDEQEFLSPYGLRTLSRHHLEHPCTFEIHGQHYQITYQPAESELSAGNSNWCGPIWFPINYLIIDALHQFYAYYGDELKAACPTSSGHMLNMGEVATELSRRMERLFLRDETSNHRRAAFGGTAYFQHDPRWCDYLPFPEYFHGDNGAGIGASHQTGWTALVASLLQEVGSKQAPQPATISPTAHPVDVQRTEQETLESKEIAAPDSSPPAENTAATPETGKKKAASPRRKTRKAADASTTEEKTAPTAETATAEAVPATPPETGKKKAASPRRKTRKTTTDTAEEPASTAAETKKTSDTPAKGKKKTTSSRSKTRKATASASGDTEGKDKAETGGDAQT